MIELSPDFITQQYLQQCNAIIAIVDSSDRQQQHKLIDIFQQIKNLTNRQIPTLLIANKQDKTNANDKNDIEAEVQVSALTNKYFTVETSLNGDIIDEQMYNGMAWLCAQLKQNIELSYHAFKQVHYGNLNQQALALTQYNPEKQQLDETQKYNMTLTQSSPQWMN